MSKERPPSPADFGLPEASADVQQEDIDAFRRSEDNVTTTWEDLGDPGKETRDIYEEEEYDPGLPYVVWDEPEATPGSGDANSRTYEEDQARAAVHRTYQQSEQPKTEWYQAVFDRPDEPRDPNSYGGKKLYSPHKLAESRDVSMAQEYKMHQQRQPGPDRIHRQLERVIRGTELLGDEFEEALSPEDKETLETIRQQAADNIESENMDVTTARELTRQFTEIKHRFDPDFETNAAGRRRGTSSASSTGSPGSGTAFRQPNAGAAPHTGSGQPKTTATSTRPPRQTPRPKTKDVSGKTPNKTAHPSKTVKKNWNKWRRKRR